MPTCFLIWHALLLVSVKKVTPTVSDLETNREFDTIFILRGFAQIYI
jgi:hypothetical protein